MTKMYVRRNPKYLENDGLVWNGRDTRELIACVKAGLNRYQIGLRLGRSPQACDKRIQMVRVGLLYTSGSDEDTLRTFELDLLPVREENE